MIVCPNCSHQNPDSAAQCEACYTPLPTLTTCPSCGAPVQEDASFCGQCGFNLRAAGGAAVPLTTSGSPLGSDSGDDSTIDPSSLPPPLPALEPLAAPEPLSLEPLPMAPLLSPPTASPQSTPLNAVTATEANLGAMGATQIQVSRAKLIHLQTDSLLELPPHLDLVRIGKPNDRIPPDIDVSGFPNSEIVSRAHAQLRVEGDSYYIEDVGSSNGTYINNMPLPYGNRHRLRPGDRIALGKGDKVTFLFQCSE